MIKIRRATHEDMYCIKLQSLPLYAHTYAFDEVLHPRDFLTIHAKDTVLAMICISLINGGVAHVNAFLMCEIHKYPVSFVRFFKKLLIDKILEHKLHRVQMDVPADYPEAHALAVSLGFSPEGVMRKYGHNKKDFVLYARLP